MDCPLNTSIMRKRILKKSKVLREGYVKGLKHAKCIINEMIENEYDKLPGIQLIKAAMNGDF